ncbi:MAG: glutamine-hydrolyzing GMP synthase [Candidatus Lokiarchaeota archaeon]|nr:glutamine-hydrolyzing GMP synthase [Candidatus Lokiarchaeota archaeon]
MVVLTQTQIIVLDFGGQYCHLICRRVRDAGVYAEIRPFNVKPDVLSNLHVKGIILSGGPSSVYETDAPMVDTGLLAWCKANKVPVLGLCYGHQLLGQLIGGKVEANAIKEYGRTLLHVQQPVGVLATLGGEETVWMSHGDQVKKLPDGFEILASTKDCPIAAFRSLDNLISGLQFHPEVKHTPRGQVMLENFLFSICGCMKDWSMETWIKDAISSIKQEVGSRQVLLALSGGVDSTVVSVLLQKAIGNQLHCVFVDNGVMRKNEGKDVEEYFTNVLGYKQFHRADAQDKFLSKLAGVTDPEQKRKIIGFTFIEVFEEYAKQLEAKHGRFDLLAQGTIYPDRVESAATSKASAKIKSHHNLTLPEKMQMSLIEPLKDLYKDEVRKVGRMLGIPEDIIKRHPFPGPGLAVRCVGEVKKEYLDMLRDADAILTHEIKLAGIYDTVWQAFVVFLPVKTVGVMGDFRTYQFLCSIRIVESVDAMTANFARLDWDLLDRISTRIINEVRGINRVVYDITNKPPGTIEYE